MFLKGHYPHNFERAAKSVTCVQIESIQIDGFKNVKKKKNQNGTPLPWKPTIIPEAKNAFTLAKISQV